MATKKTTKSSKTAHVLNVLSNTPAESEALDTGSIHPQETAPRPVRPPVLEVTKSEDSILADQIHDSLIQDLENLLPGLEAPEAPLVESAPLAAAAEAPTDLIAEAPAAEAAPARPSNDIDSIPSPPPNLSSTVDLPSDLIYINVMQTLVEDKAPRYFKMFDMCTCSRCVADVKAMALTNLPPKYAVVKRGDEAPLLTFHEGRHSTAITAQIISACKMVIEHPRH